MFLNENFRYNITDPTQYDPSTPLTFSFIAQTARISNNPRSCRI